MEPEDHQPDELDCTRIDATEMPDPSGVPERIGPYRLLQKVGEGGMGEVYQAEQLEPIQRIVALKLIKLGMASQHILHRFESERQALALMDHPSIARVLDAGTTDEGRPYFVMEYAKGVPIDEYCNKFRLDTARRLELFVQVCDGVQHAHQKGIIHRDIKPSNILVTIQDAKPVPKIIDFGVAKAMDRRLTGHTAHTEIGQMIGTPDYMSPEQAEMTGLDIDTRSDVYSLGVVLYQLLVGSLPFEVSKVTLQSGLMEALRRIREDEPDRPSVRARSTDPPSVETARGQGTDPPGLVRRLKGDLDWITIKALDKDRTRRYESVSELANDIRRHFRHEPVLAGPPSTWYKLRKYVRRHRTASAAAVVIALLLAGFGATMAYQAQRIARERDRANLEAAAAHEIAAYLESIFEVSDPGEARGNTITAREVLDRGASDLDRDLAGQPALQARMMETIGRVYRGLGLYHAALPLLEKAVAIRRAQQGGDDAALAAGLIDVGRALYLLDDYRRAREVFEEARFIGEKALAPDHPDMVDSLQYLAMLHRDQGEFDLARPLFERVLEIRERPAGQEDPDLANALNNLALLHFKTGQYDVARPLLERARAIRERTLGEDHPDVASALNHLGNLYRKTGHLERARRTHEHALAIREKTLGPDHRNTAESVYNLAGVLFSQGADAERAGRPEATALYEEARPLFERALEVRERILPDMSPTIAESLHGLANVHLVTENFAAARPLYERALEVFEDTRSTDHPDFASCVRNLGVCLKNVREYRRALEHLERALGIRLETLPKEHPDVAQSLADVAYVSYLLGDFATARRHYEQRLAIWEETGDSRIKGGLFDLACVTARQGDKREALDFLSRAVEHGLDDEKPLEDSDLDVLREEPEFRALVAKVRSRAATD